jgi:hypothetical protein
VIQRPLRLRAPQFVGGDFNFSKTVGLFAVTFLTQGIHGSFGHTLACRLQDACCRRPSNGFRNLR